MSNIVSECINPLLSYFVKLLIVLEHHANEGSNLGGKIEIFFIVNFICKYQNLAKCGLKLKRIFQFWYLEVELWTNKNTCMANILPLLCKAAKILLFKMYKFVLQICHLLAFLGLWPINLRSVDQMFPSITNKNLNRWKNKLGLSFYYFTINLCSHSQNCSLTDFNFYIF